MFKWSHTTPSELIILKEILDCQCSAFPWPIYLLQNSWRQPQNLSV